MQIVYHLGAHCTDDDRLIRALLKNRGTLAAAGISVPAPRKYRQILPKIAKSVGGQEAAADTQNVILDAVMETEEAHRLVFSHDALMCFPVNVVSDAGFYATAPKRIAAYANLFPDQHCEFHLALRNPATLIPELIKRTNDGTYQALMGDRHPLTLRWANVVRRIVGHLPGIDLTIWCNEDTPLLWPELLRNLAGIEAEDALEGDFDLLAAIMTEDGLAKLKLELDTNPPDSVENRRAVTAEFLADHARPDEIEMDIDLPGWSADLVAEITLAYDADCAEIAEMDDVSFLTP